MTNAPAPNLGKLIEVRILTWIVRFEVLPLDRMRKSLASRFQICPDLSADMGLIDNAIERLEKKEIIKTGFNDVPRAWITQEGLDRALKRLRKPTPANYRPGPPASLSRERNLINDFLLDVAEPREWMYFTSSEMQRRLDRIEPRRNVSRVIHGDRDRRFPSDYFLERPGRPFSRVAEIHHLAEDGVTSNTRLVKPMPTSALRLDKKVLRQDLIRILKANRKAGVSYTGLVFLCYANDEGLLCSNIPATPSMFDKLDLPSALSIEVWTQEPSGLWTQVPEEFLRPIDYRYTSEQIKQLNEIRHQAGVVEGSARRLRTLADKLLGDGS